jgi:Family of unknown function (DUF5995)
MTFQPAKDIDEVIQRLDEIIQWCSDTRNPLGIFPALYVVVTEKVKEGIAQGNVFEDGPRMAKLDVIFANRYLEAFHQLRNGQKPSLCWQASFDAAAKFHSYLIIQELLLGMNAHINLDLGVAAATTCPGKSIQGLKQDFMSINVILNALVDDIKDDLERLSPRFAWVVRHMVGEDAILEFSIKVARNHAWKFAKDLAGTPQPQWAAPISKKDEGTTKLANVIASPGIWGGLIVWWVKRAESKDIPHILKELRDTARAKVKFPSEVASRYHIPMED